VRTSYHPLTPQILIAALIPFCADVLLLRFPRSRFGNSEPRTRLRDHSEPDVVNHRRSLIPVAARARLCPLYADHFSDRGVTDGRLVLAPCARGLVVRVA